MRLIVGTSGYSYKEWKGTFYPDDLPAAKMLAKWATEVPDGFTFVLKAPQRITHQKRLVGAGDDVAQLFEAAQSLGPKLGPVLFQLPPYSRKDARSNTSALPLLISHAICHWPAEDALLDRMSFNA